MELGARRYTWGARSAARTGTPAARADRGMVRSTPGHFWRWSRATLRTRPDKSRGDSLESQPPLTPQPTVPTCCQFNCRTTND
jgi:hypothetical protein